MLPYTRPQIERDPSITKMRLDVFDAMDSIAAKAFPEQQSSGNLEIRFVSFEEALRELAQIKSSSQFV